MIILVDLGNTNIDVGVYLENKKLISRFRFHTDKVKSESEYQTLFDSFLNYNKIEKAQITGGIISSVVPSLTSKIKLAIDNLLNIDTLLVNKGLKSGLILKIDNPNELGSDLLCDALGAYEKYKSNCIIVDLGTVSKILIVTENKEYLGGVLFPGVQIQKDSLYQNAALLYDTELHFPKNIIGKSTSIAISSGILNSILYTIEGFSLDVIKSTNKSYIKILTGGDAYLFKDKLTDFHLEDELTFLGLFDLYMKNRKN